MYAASHCSPQKNHHRSGSCKTIHGEKPTPGARVRPRPAHCLGKSETRKKTLKKMLSSRARERSLLYSRSPIHISGPGAPPRRPVSGYSARKDIMATTNNNCARRRRCPPSHATGAQVLLFIVNERGRKIRKIVNSAAAIKSLPIKKVPLFAPGPAVGPAALTFPRIYGARTGCCVSAALVRSGAG